MAFPDRGTLRTWSNEGGVASETQSAACVEAPANTRPI